ncbi:thioredoxin-dependent thiol peroxidase [Iamia sp.]|uniref:thioredoxin-dependent thiol peroxidase n=1 Tax=Iamia sp. TaxID=2722710 RepID=UPI002C477A77|nr:thioredoxin-dependent thiol peroxidase [Iamia sp.]HXH58105.1 thioredoxin-dependent thiol peroxidase [Iamia sp.]
MAETPAPGTPAPAITLLDQHGDEFDVASLAGRRILIYFYPKADTPGCTTQSCGLRNVAADVGDTAIIGISPDPPAKLARFDEKHGLGFALLSDPDHEVAGRYGVWAEKSMYGRKYMGIVRSAFLIGGEGEIVEAWPKVSPTDTPTKLVKALAALEG